MPPHSDMVPSLQQEEGGPTSVTLMIDKYAEFEYGGSVGNHILTVHTVQSY